MWLCVSFVSASTACLQFFSGSFIPRQKLYLLDAWFPTTLINESFPLLIRNGIHLVLFQFLGLVQFSTCPIIDECAIFTITAWLGKGRLENLLFCWRNFPFLIFRLWRGQERRRQRPLWADTWLLYFHTYLLYFIPVCGKWLMAKGNNDKRRRRTRKRLKVKDRWGEGDINTRRNSSFNRDSDLEC